MTYGLGGLERVRQIIIITKLVLLYLARTRNDNVELISSDELL